MSERAPLAAFGRRNAILLKLGFPNYEAYLLSELWHGIRIRVLKRDKFTCCACSGPARQVHHREYSRATLLGKKLAALVTICYECHRKIEFYDGRKTSPHEANRALAAIIRKRQGRKKPRREREMSHIYAMEE